jgi:NAD(P)H-hydrate repair Nnr-like enzyme with NAD(P)H-hydrate epimerase domain
MKVILLGKGNNAGDSIVVCNFLKENNFDFIIYQLFEEKEYSPLLKEMIKENQTLQKNIVFLKDIKDLKINKNTLIIDAIFGSGVNYSRLKQTSFRIVFKQSFFFDAS